MVLAEAVRVQSWWLGFKLRAWNWRLSLVLAEWRLGFRAGG